MISRMTLTLGCLYITTALYGSFPGRTSSAGRTGSAGRISSAWEATIKCSTYIEAAKSQCHLRYHWN